MLVLLVVAVLGLHGVGRQQHARLGRAVDVVRQDRILHLKHEEKGQLNKAGSKEIKLYFQDVVNKLR